MQYPPKRGRVARETVKCQVKNNKLANCTEKEDLGCKHQLIAALIYISYCLEPLLGVDPVNPKPTVAIRLARASPHSKSTSQPTLPIHIRLI